MTTSTEHLKGIIRDSADELLRAERIESASITMGDKLILIGPRSELARMLGYSLADEAATLSAITGAARLWLGLNAAGQVAQFWTKEPDASAHPALCIVGYQITPGAAAASIPAGPELTDAQIDAIWKRLDGDNCWIRTFGYQQFARAVLEAAKAAAIPAGWREFIENIATPYSEPLNSISGYRDKASRQDAMGELREKAQHLLWTAPAAPTAAAAPESQPSDSFTLDLDAYELLCQKKDAEIVALHARLASETLRADQGWQRYESANADRNDLRAAMHAPVPAASEGAPSLADRAANCIRTGINYAASHIEKQAADYLRQNASTEPDTGATVFQYGEAGRDYHSTLVELAEEIRALAAPAAPATSDKAED